MNDTKLLVRTPPPHATESLLGYALRVSQLNGYHTPWYVFTHAGIRQGQVDTAGMPVEKLAKVLGKSAEDLQHIAYCQPKYGEGKGFNVLGHSLGGSLSMAPLRLNQPAFCPHCVMNEGYIDAFWDLTIAVACPVHRCQVIRNCSSCSAKLTWWRPGILTCKCGGSLNHVGIPEESTALCELLDVIRGVMHRVPSQSDLSKCGLPVAQLQRVPFGSLVRGLFKLGHYALTHAKRADDAENPLKVMRKTAEILSSWPSKYHELLGQIGSEPSIKNTKSAGLRSQFQGFYHTMFIGRNWHKDFEFLRQEFVNFGQTVWGQAIVDPKLLREKSGVNGSATRFIPLSELVRTTGIRDSTLKRLADQGFLSMTKVPLGRQTRYIVDTTSLSLSAYVPGRTRGSRRAAAYLGFPVSVLHALRKSGHFRVQHATKRTSWFHQDDLDVFRQRLFDRVPCDQIEDKKSRCHCDVFSYKERTWRVPVKRDLCKHFLTAK